jgi:hypothetical protein
MPMTIDTFPHILPQPLFQKMFMARIVIAGVLERYRPGTSIGVRTLRATIAAANRICECFTRIPRWAAWRGLFARQSSFFGIDHVMRQRFARLSN